MLEYSVATTYQVLDLQIELFANETAYGKMTVALIGETPHQIGNRPVNVDTAIRVWEILNDRLMTKAEYDQVIITNGSQAI
jgi:hypothetical protein